MICTKYEEVMFKIGMARDTAQRSWIRRYFWCRMSDDILLKQVVFGIIKRSNRRKR